jgi:dihydrofolate reductase
VIGAGGAIPWRLKSDMQRFKAMTMGKPVVMGRKTFVSIAPAASRTDQYRRHARRRLSRRWRGGHHSFADARRLPPAMRCGVSPLRSR